MNPTEYWEERLQQMQADHEAEVRRMRERIVELEEQLALSQQMLADFTQLSITSGYDGSSCNPRIFAHKIDAERNATQNEIVVELDVIERGASDGELLAESDAWIP